MSTTLTPLPMPNNYISLDNVRQAVIENIASHSLFEEGEKCVRVYGVPSKGLYIVGIMRELGLHMEQAFRMDTTVDLVVDDLIDSGTTRQRFKEKYPHTPFLAAFTKTPGDSWLVFPWDVDDISDTSAEDIPRRLLQFIGEDVNRGGLVETPARFVRAWQEYSSGYAIDPLSYLKTFEDGAVDEMVVQIGIPFYSHCEHHLAPFFGTVDIGYIPAGKVVGLSKLKRVVDVFAKRLQVQERFTDQIANALADGLSARGVVVRARARHLCMEMRGISTAGVTTSTCALRGVFKVDATARKEFYDLAQ